MRRLVAALACRVQGSRLYGKPLQSLDLESGTTILDHLVRLLQSLEPLGAVVLGVAEGAANTPFAEYAARKGIDHIVGDEKDVLGRLVQCAHRAGGTDVFRITSESPFPYFEMVEPVWRRHLEAGNDVTVVDGLPEGTHFEIYTRDALQRSHDHGDDRHRSEYCSLYVREHRHDFTIEVVPIPPAMARLDLRLTVDYPEDLVLCRAVYAHLKRHAPRMPLAEIVGFLDSRPDLTAMVAPYVVPKTIWT